MPSSSLMTLNELGLTKRLIVAPMAGGPTTPQLVVAASNAGALGSLGAAYLSPSAIENSVREIREGTTRPFAINLFAPHPLPKLSDRDFDRAVEATREFRNELSLPSPVLAPPFEEDFANQFEAVMRVKPAVLSWTFGHLPTEYVRAARARGVRLIGTATSREEALAIQDECDAVVLQGIEAGGHRGLFSLLADDPEITLAELLRTVRLRVPVIAAGGIMTAKDIRAALDAGAWAVQLGTAFLLCHEAGTSNAYREVLRGKRETRTTRVFSGRLARGIENRFMREMPADAVMPFPQQNKFTRDLRAAGGADFMSLWSGTGPGTLWEGRCADLIDRLFASEPDKK